MNSLLLLSLATLCGIYHLCKGTQHGDSDCYVSDISACDVCNCSGGGRTVNCVRRNLTALPSNIPPQVIVLNLDDNLISCVPKNHFENLTKLLFLSISMNKLRASFFLPRKVRELKVNDNQLEEADDFFPHCDELQLVKLSGNKIRNFSTRGIDSCYNLNHLYLSSNLITRIDGDSFSAFPGINILSLTRNIHLSEIHGDAFSAFCGNLQRIYLPECSSLSNLPSSLLSNCSRVTSINLSGTSIVSINPDIFASPTLQDIDLSNNRYANILESTFARLKNVQRLDLSMMDIVIPPTLFATTNLNFFLDLTSNGLKNIPVELFSSNATNHRLQVLGLSGNELTNISPEVFWPLRYLKELHLDDNDIIRLPEGMLTGTNTQSLYLFRNQITRLNESLFYEGVTNTTLTTVFAQNNPIQQLSDTFLTGIITGGSLILTCDNVTVPPVSQNVSVRCVPGDFLTTINATTNSWAKSLSRRGFSCNKVYDSWMTYHWSICQTCPTGTYGGNDDGCTKCPRGGFYQDTVGQFKRDGYENGCKTCNRGNFVDFEGGASPLDCKVCPDGTNRARNASFRACFCVENYFRRDRFDKCELCPAIGANCSDDILLIKYGYYWNWTHGDIDKYRSFVTNLMILNDSYDRSTTSYKTQLPSIHICPDQFKCENDKDNIMGNCKVGYTGWLCAQCDDGYFAIFGFCQQCPRIWVFIVEIVVVLLLSTFFTVYVIVVYRRESEVTSRSIIDVVLARGKIILGFYQVMGEFWNSLNVIFWQSVFQHIAYLINMIQLNISAILVKPSCFVPFFDLNAYFEFIVGITTPFIIIVTSGLCVAVFKLITAIKSNYRQVSGGASLKSFVNKMLLITFLGLFVTYPSTCNVIFALYRPACDSFPVDENMTHNTSLLRPDYSIDCTTDLHSRFEIAAYVSSIYVVAFPGVLFCLLLKFSRDNEEYPIWLRFMSENYTEGFWFWEIVELVRKVSQTLVIIIFGWDSMFSVIVTLALSVVFLVLHTSFAPMKDKFEHYLQLASLWAIFLNMLIAAVPRSDVFESNGVEAIGILLVSLNLIVLCIALGKPVMWVVKVFLSTKFLQNAVRLILQCCTKRQSSRLSIHQLPLDVDKPSSTTPLLDAGAALRDS